LGDLVYFLKTYILLERKSAKLKLSLRLINYYSRTYNRQGYPAFGTIKMKNGQEKRLAVFYLKAGLLVPGGVNRSLFPFTKGGEERSIKGL
jgi:hypothetical protein